MTHYIGVVASLAIRRSPASAQPVNLLEFDPSSMGYGGFTMIRALTDISKPNFH